MNSNTEDILQNPDKNFAADMVRADPMSSSRGLFKSNVYAVTIPNPTLTSAKATGLSVANPIVSFGEDSSSGPMFKCGCDLSADSSSDICGICAAFMELQEGIKHFALIVNLESLLQDCEKGNKPTRDFRTRIQLNMYVNTFSPQDREEAEDISDSDGEKEEQGDSDWPSYIRNQGDFSNDKRDRIPKSLNTMYPPIGRDTIRGKRKTIVTPKKRSHVRRKLLKDAEQDTQQCEKGNETVGYSPKTPPNTPQRKRRTPAAPRKEKKKRKSKGK